MPRPIPDYRGTREADETRDMTNHKPFRTKALKIEAHAYARKCEDGAWRSPVKTLEFN